MTPAVFHRASDVHDSVESLIALHGRRTRYTYWAALVLAMALLGGLPWLKVASTLGAPGQLRSAVDRIAIHPAVAGRIVHLHVRDNQRVKAGDVLLTLDAAAPQAALAQTTAQILENDRATADLGLLLERSRGDAFAPAETGRESPATEEDRPLLQTPEYERQAQYLEQQLARLRLQWSRAAQEAKRLGRLHARGLVTDHEHEQAVFAAQSLQQEIKLTRQQTLSRWATELRERQLRTGTLAAETERLKALVEAYQLRAPMDGVALGFTGLSPGLHVPLDLRLGEITPSDALQADVFLRPRDVGFIRVGQAVRLHVEAFPYAEWGHVAGRVRSLSADVLHLDQQSAFKAVVELESLQLAARSGAAVKLHRGMTVQARFHLQERTLFHVLFGKLSDALDPRVYSSEP